MSSFEPRKWFVMVRTEKCRDDQGFSILEVVIAAALLFFVTTAILGLLAATTNMSASAKGRAAITNAVSSAMDRVRAIPFDKVAVGGSGLVPASETVVIGGYTVTLTYTVSDFTNSTNATKRGTKEIQIVAVASRPGLPSVTSTTLVAVRDSAGGFTAASTSTAEPLTVAFGPLSPPSQAVLYSNQEAGQGTLVIDATAESMDGNVTKFDFYVDTDLLQDTNITFSNKATHNVSPLAPTATWSFNWNTLQVDGSGDRMVQDGMRLVRIHAEDDQGNVKETTRSFMVDNDPPDAPGSPYLYRTAPGTGMDQVLAFGWTNALDGTDPVFSYQGQLFENLAGGSTLDSWSQVGTDRTAPAAGLAAAPFAQYGFQVRSVGPSPRVLTSSYIQTASQVTSPVISGTCTVSKATGGILGGANGLWTFSNVLSVPKPRFPYESGSLVVQILRTPPPPASASLVDVTTAAQAAWTAGNAYSYTDSMTFTGPKNSNPQQGSYRLRVTITPLGYDSGSRVLQSNRVLTYASTSSLPTPNPIAMVQTW